MISTLSVRQVQERYGVTEHTVFAWIHSGESKALNVGRKPGKKKPRWRITQAALEAFEMARTATPPSTRGRRKRPADVIQFYLRRTTLPGRVLSYKTNVPSRETMMTKKARIENRPVSVPVCYLCDGTPSGLAIIFEYPREPGIPDKCPLSLCVGCIRHMAAVAERTLDEMVNSLCFNDHENKQSPLQLPGYGPPVQVVLIRRPPSREPERVRMTVIW